MPWVGGMAMKTEKKSSKWIAQETTSKAAFGKMLETCILQDQATCLLHYQNLLVSAKQQQQMKWHNIME